MPDTCANLSFLSQADLSSINVSAMTAAPVNSSPYPTVTEVIPALATLKQLYATLEKISLFQGIWRPKLAHLYTIPNRSLGLIETAEIALGHAAYATRLFRAELIKREDNPYQYGILPPEETEGINI